VTRRDGQTHFISNEDITSMNIACPECDTEYDIEETCCPNCGFGPDSCSHPQSHRDSGWIYSVNEGQHVEQVYCSKCGTPVAEF